MLQLIEEIKGTAVPAEAFAGLCGCDFRKQSLHSMAGLLGRLLEAQGQTLWTSDHSGEHIAISARTCDLHVTRDADIVWLTLTRKLDTLQHLLDAEATLAGLLRDLIPALQPRDIHWLAHGAMIDPVTFQEITGGIVPGLNGTASPQYPQVPDLRQRDMPCCTAPVAGSTHAQPAQ